jgi:hypothetical protein
MINLLYSTKNSILEDVRNENSRNSKNVQAYSGSGHAILQFNNRNQTFQSNSETVAIINSSHLVKLHYIPSKQDYQKDVPNYPLKLIRASQQKDF